MKQTIKILILFLIIVLGYSQEEPPELFEYNNSTLQTLYLINLVLINNTEIESNDWVGAFKGDVCVGSYQWNTAECGGEVCSINIMVDD